MPLSLVHLASSGTTVLDASLLSRIPIAVLAGLISFLSPCVLPLVPGYLGFIGGAVTPRASTGSATGGGGSATVGVGSASVGGTSAADAETSATGRVSSRSARSTTEILEA